MKEKHTELKTILLFCWLLWLLWVLCNCRFVMIFYFLLLKWKT